VDYSQARFQQITDDYSLLADQLGFAEFTSIPISALNGDNIIHPSTRMSWYDGPTLIHQLESIDVSSSQAEKAMRMPVQWVNRANADFRGYSGTLASGIANVGDRVVVLPGARTTTIQSIVTAEGNLASALPEQAITICLEDAIDISRGDVIAAAESRPEVTDQFEASVVWMHEDPMLPGRPYLIRTENKTVPAVVTRLKYRVNINNYKDEPAEALALNEVGLCNFSLSEPIAFDPYRENRVMGSFIIIDRVSNNTIGCGMINHGLRRAQNIHWQAVDIDKQARAGAKQQRPALLWFTGLSGSGKSSIANLVEKKLFALGKHSYLLDGDNVRHGLNRDLGFTDVDRVENIRRIAETGKLMIDAGLIVLTSFISPFQAERSLARNLLEAGEFIEIFVDTPIEVCEARDPKGLYQKVRKGELKNFTGFDSPYETPENAEIHIRTVDESAEDAAERIVTYLLAQEKL
jgi:bifunctional enzyme CysN/CysC